MGKKRKRDIRKKPSKPIIKHGDPSRKSSLPSSPSIEIIQLKLPAPSPVLFGPTDRVLLVGEGDFSFSKALLTSYNCTSILATSYDSRSLVIAKYPQAASNIEALDDEKGRGSRVLFAIDATKIGTNRVGSGGKRIKKGEFDRIVFNFPHVGGKTKDVTRQIRHNQELLLGFFKAAVPLLAPMGIVIVTLFEGSPYESWDLKGLAKNAGLKSQRSFRFEPGRYPGYKHARTLGTIEGGRGWKGEERPARTYLLELTNGKTLEGESQGGASKRGTGSNMQTITNERNLLTRKRKRAETDSDSN